MIRWSEATQEKHWIPQIRQQQELLKMQQQQIYHIRE
jgi:hypothetical protein